MKRFLWMAALVVAAMGANAQNRQGEAALVGSAGYQSDYKRFGLDLQGRYSLTDHFRLAPDVTFFFPKDKVTGLDVDVNLHYVFNGGRRSQGLTFYGLAGLAMQNNFYGDETLYVEDIPVKVEHDNTTRLACNLGAGISFPVSKHGFLNAESKVMIGNDTNFVLMLGYGYRF